MVLSNSYNENGEQKLTEMHLVTQTAEDIQLNASGHVQEVDRTFNRWSISSMAITTGSVWPALGGSITVAIYNGGPPGVIWEFVVVSVFYWFIAASIAELASSIPSSAGVYHWASVGAGPRWGKFIGFFAGFTNCLAWILGTASISSIAGQIVISMWAIFHDDYIFQRWHVFIVYLMFTWLGCFAVCFCHRTLPIIAKLSAFLIVFGALITICCCAVLPTTNETGYATNSFVWKDWSSLTGYPSGFTFLAGMLNGAYAVGTPDITSHLAEEIPNPSRNIPRAIFAQYFFGFVTGFPYLIAIFYSISDMDTVLRAQVPFPLAAVYLQTGSSAAAFGLLLVVLCPIVCVILGCYITSGRTLWTLARDNATPFSDVLARVHPRYRNQFNATICCGFIVTGYGAIYVGSLTAFNAFVGSFIILSTLSYASAILPNVLFRDKYIKPGPFNLGKTWGRIIGIVSCAYIIVFIFIYCFPFYIPTDAKSMNYTSLITGGSTIFIGLWYIWKRTHGYEGPAILLKRY